MFRSFNLTGDAMLTSIADKLEAFEGIEADELRENDHLRKQMAVKADEILAALKDLI